MAIKGFNEYLQERILNIGLNPKHEKHREAYRGQIHDIIRKSYEKVKGGYGGHGSGSKAESDAIHADISSNAIKATRRGDTITQATIYKPQHGRKIIAMGHNQTKAGSADWSKTAGEDIKKKRAWGELSGGAKEAYAKRGMPVVPSSRAGELTGKKVKIVDKDRYERDIGGKPHTKSIMGYPKE